MRRPLQPQRRHPSRRKLLLQMSSPREARQRSSPASESLSLCMTRRQAAPHVASVSCRVVLRIIYHSCSFSCMTTTAAVLSAVKAYEYPPKAAQFILSPSPQADASISTTAPSQPRSSPRRPTDALPDRARPSPASRAPPTIIGAGLAPITSAPDPRSTLSTTFISVLCGMGSLVNAL